MSANVESMFSVREVPWHREGVVLGEYPGSWAEAREAAGLGWDPVCEPVFELSGVDWQGYPIYNPIKDWQRITRSDTHATLSIRPESYTVIDHQAMGEIIEAVLREDHVKYETAGSLNGGCQVWCLTMLDEPIELPGDASLTLPYMAITNSHDGKGACSLRATTVRIVCANTYRAAELEGERTGATFSFRHTANWRDRIDEARQAVTGARLEFAAYRELATDLLGVPITAGQRELFVAQFIPMPPEGLITDRVVTNVESARTAMRSIIDSATVTGSGIEGTAYGLVQAAGEYLDHVRRARTWETRLNRSLMRPEPLKAKALQLAREVATV